jgi:Spy/CpxP family protein refolding chaperone
MTRFSAVLRSIRQTAVLLATAVTFMASATELLAQGGPPRRDSSSRRGNRAIEQQLQQRIATIMQERLQLNDEQLQQLVEVTRRFERERMQVRGEDYRLRMAMRSQLLAGDTASQERVAELLEQMPRVERRRIDLMENEQRELAKFLTPVQRARYIALQEEIRRNMEQIRERRSNQPPGTSTPHLRGPPSSTRP